MPWGVPSDFNRMLVRARKIAPPSPDDALYSWLSAVLDLNIALDQMLDDDSGRVYAALKRAHKLSGPYLKYRLLIADVCASHVEQKMQKKYAMVLALADANDIPPKDLRAFVREQGGINKCVEKQRRARE